MNTMFKAGSSLVLACALVQPVFAGEPVAETVKKGAVVPVAPVWSEGIVKKVDKTTGKLTIAHGAIKNLGMAPMTMMFRVKDPAMLEQVQSGQKIRFHVDIVNGAYTVLRIEPAQ